MEITYLKNVKKRRNSTRRPSGGTTHTAKLKHDTSIENPVFMLDVVDPDINYIISMGHYYYVTDIVVLNNDQAEYHCTQDVLATYRSTILDSNQFVLRCADQNYYDPLIIDESYPIKTEPTVYVTKSASTPPFVTGSSAALVVGVKGYNGSAFWAFRVGLFSSLGKAIYSLSQDDVWAAIQADDLDKTFLDPMSYITSAMIIPIDPSNMPGTSHYTIPLGYWSYTDPDGAQIFKELTDRICYTSSEYTLNIQAPAPGAIAFTNSNRYRKYRLILPGAGELDLDGDLVSYGTAVKVSFKIDVSGAIQYKVAYGTNNNFVTYVGGQVGIPFAIHGQTVNYGNKFNAAAYGATAWISSVAENVVGSAGASVVGGALGMLASKALGNAGALYNTATASNDGSLAGISINSDIILIETIYDISEIGVARMGAPCCKYLKLSNLSGYVRCQNASVSLPGFAEDRAAIESLMNEGIYIE